MSELELILGLFSPYFLEELGPKKLFDIIFLDPPCTATGTIGKNPDLQFLNPIDKLDELSEIQEKMLDRCSGWLEDNGLQSILVAGYLKKDIESYGVVKLTKRGKDYLNNPQSFMMSEDHVYDSNAEGDIIVATKSKSTGPEEKLMKAATFGAKQFANSI